MLLPDKRQDIGVFLSGAFCLLIFLFAAASCRVDSRAKVKDRHDPLPSKGVLPAPALVKNPASFPFIASDNLAIRYSPALIMLFNPKIEQNKLDKLLQLGKDVTKAHARVVRGKREAFEKIKSLENSLENLSKVKSSILSEATLRVFNENASKKAASWLEDVLFPLMEEAENTALFKEEVFSRYCEAMVLRLASQSLFLSSFYTERPTPNALCETYYEKQGLFREELDPSKPTPFCEDKPGGASYASCLWIDGVLKTSFLKEESSQKELSLLKETLLDPESFAAFLSAFDHKAIHFTRTMRDGKEVHYNFAKENFTAATQLQMLAKCKRPWITSLSYKKYCGILNFLGKENAALSATSPWQYINIVHGFNNAKLELPHWQTLEKTINGKVEKISFSYNHLLAFFSHSTHLTPSFGNNKFHKLRQDLTYPAAQMFLSAYEPFAPQFRDGFSQVFGVLKPQFAAQLLNLDKVMAIVKGELDTLNGVLRQNQEDVLDIANKTIHLAKEKDVMEAYLLVNPIFEKKDDILKFTMHFGSTESNNLKIMGCLDLSSQKAVLCDTRSEDFLVPSIFFGKETGKIEITFSLDRAFELGFKGDLIGSRRMEDEDVSYFYRGELFALKGHHMRLTLYPHIFENTLRILSGEVSIRKNSNNKASDLLFGVMSAFDQDYL